MSNKKDVTINYYMADAVERAVFLADLKDRLEAYEDSDADFGFFDGRTRELMFKLYAPINIADRKLYMVSLVSEKEPHPVVCFDREGGLGEVPLEQQAIGGITYGLIDCESGAVITLSQSGPSMGAFSDFIRMVTDDQSAGLSPIFRNGVRDKVEQWEVYRKLNISVEAPAVDFIDAVLSSEYGSNYEMLETLKGMKIDITVSMGRGRGSLDKNCVRAFVQKTLEDGFAGKLAIAGKNFDEQHVEEYDLYNARLRFQTTIVIQKNIVAPEEAKASLFEAYQVELDQIEVAQEMYERHEA